MVVMCVTSWYCVTSRWVTLGGVENLDPEEDEEETEVVGEVEGEAEDEDVFYEDSL